MQPRQSSVLVDSCRYFLILIFVSVALHSEVPVHLSEVVVPGAAASSPGAGSTAPYNGTRVRYQYVYTAIP